jgi:hypothetical protein
MFTRLILAGTTLVLGLASCGGTPTVKAATPAEKSEITSTIDEVTAKIKSLNLSLKSQNLAAQATTGSVKVDCDTGSLTLSFKKDANGVDTLNLKSARCIKGDVTFSDMDVDVRFNLDYEPGTLTFSLFYDGALTYKNAKKTLNIKYTKLQFDAKATSETVDGVTKNVQTSTINGTISINDSFVTYENEVTVISKTL